MTLTNKDQRLAIQGSTIQLKGSTLQEYKFFKIAYDKFMQSMFLEYINNYLTHEKFAQDYYISIVRAGQFIAEAKSIHERLVKDQITTKASKELGMNKKALDEKLIFIMG